MSKQEKTDANDGAGKAEVRLDVAEWARRKATPAWLVAAAIQHADWPVSTTETAFEQLVTESDFDTTCATVRSLPIR